MDKKLKVLMIGAHPDDCDFLGGGTAIKYVKAGHEVRFLSICNGCGGHQELPPKVTVKRRYDESRNVERLTGIKYDVWDINDCEVIADLETRKRLIRYIRQFHPDIIFSHRTNDYHADHRNVAILVQDASYLLVVPNFCPEETAMKGMPVIMYFSDRFINPPFIPTIAISTEEVIDEKYDMLDCHESQIYEWLPFTHGELDKVPKDRQERREWYRAPRIPREKVLSVEQLQKYKTMNHSEYTESVLASKYRDMLVVRYGEKGKSVLFAEFFQLSEYGKQLDEKNVKILFPF